MGIIQRQGIQNTVVTYAGIVIGFVNLLVIQPHFLSPEEVGLTRVLFSFSSLIAVFLPLGMGHITTRYFPFFRDKEKGHNGFFGFMLLFPMAGFVVVSALLWLTHDFIIGLYVKESRLFTEYYNYVFPLSFVLGLITVLNIYSFSLFRTTFPSFLNDVVTRVFTIVVISLYFIKVISLDQFVFLFVAVYGLQLLLLLSFIFKIDKPSFRINFQKVKEQKVHEILEYGMYLSFASIASLGIKYLDAIMIAHYRPLAMAGVYAIAAFIPAIIEAPLNALEKITNTKVSQALATNNRKEIEEIYYRSSRYLLLLGGILFIGINSNIENLLSFLPEDYHGGKWVVLIISIGTMFNMASGSNVSILFSSEHYKYGVFLLVFLVVTAFFSNMLLIPRYGMEGAAMATAISAFVYSFLRFVFIYQKFRLQPYDLKTFLVVLLIAGGFGLNHLLPVLDNRILDIVFRSIVVTVFYGAGTFLLRIVPEFHKYLGVGK